MQWHVPTGQFWRFSGIFAFKSYKLRNACIFVCVRWTTFSPRMYRLDRMYQNLRLRPYFRILACTMGSLRQKLALALVYRDLLYPIFTATFEINKYPFEYWNYLLVQYFKIPQKYRDCLESISTVAERCTWGDGWWWRRWPRRWALWH